jgi:serine/threonine-protein kinase RsbW
MNRKTLGVQLPSEFGWERAAMDFAARVARRIGFSSERIEDLLTALNEAIVNAIEHGNAFEVDRQVHIVLVPAEDRLQIDVRDFSRRPFPPGLATRQRPNLDEAIAGRAQLRGWGSFLIRALVDEAEFSSTNGGNVVKMIMHLHPVGLPRSGDPG